MRIRSPSSRNFRRRVLTRSILMTKGKVVAAVRTCCEAPSFHTSVSRAPALLPSQGTDDSPASHVTRRLLEAVPTLQRRLGVTVC